MDTIILLKWLVAARYFQDFPTAKVKQRKGKCERIEEK